MENRLRDNRFQPTPKPEFRFVEFVQDGGSKITINSAHVIAISEWPSDEPVCAIYLLGSIYGHGCIKVKSTYPEVKERCLS